METETISTNIRSLLPEIRRRREEVEAGRRLPRDLVDEMRRTGVFGLTIPRDLGGAEASPLDVMKTIETVAAADGSVGWCTMIATGNNVVSGYMSEAGAAEVFSRPESPSAGIAAPAGAAVRVADGVRVSGRWGFASGITHCDWVWAGCLVMENGRPRMTPAGPDIIHVCLPVRDVVIHDTWHVSGLRGTGSNDFTVTDVFVPEPRIFKLLDPAGHRQEPLYQMPPLPLFVFQLACVGLGIARGALDDLAELAQTKMPTLYTAVLADKAIAHIELARAESALGGARAYLRETVDDIWQTVRAGGVPTARQVALGRAAATHATATAASVTGIVNTLAGGSSIYSSSSLQRHVRDAEAVTHHFTVAPHTWEEAGRVLLGRKPISPIF